MTKQLRADRAKIFEQMKAMVATAEKENRNLSGDEQANYDKANADAAELKTRYERIEAQEDNEREMSQSRGSVVDTVKHIEVADHSNPYATEAYRSAWLKYFRSGMKDTSVFTRDLNTTVPADGGYTVPVAIQNQVRIELQAMSIARRAGANILSTNVRTTIPVSNVPTGTWEPERDPYGNGVDTDPTIGAFAAQPRKYTMRTTISEELMFDSAVNIEAYVTNLFTKSFAVASDAAYINGAGPSANQPTGILKTATPVALDSATLPTAAGIKAAFYELPQQYRSSPNCAWVGSDKFIGFAAGAFLNQVQQDFHYATTPGETDTLFGKPMYSSGTVTDTWAADAMIGAIVDFSQYQIVDFNAYSALIRLDELSALTGAVQILGRFATDGKLLFPNAGRSIVLAHV